MEIALYNQQRENKGFFEVSATWTLCNLADKVNTL